MLTISPVGGLCNRLYALHSAIHLADAAQQDLRLLWQRDEKFGAHFHDLFEPIPSVKAYVDKDRLRRGTIGTLIENIRLSTYRPKVLCDLRWDQVIALAKEDFDFASYAASGDRCIQALSMFFAADATFYDFRPLPRFREAAREVLSDDRKLIGIHIRRTDHRPAITHSTTDLFVRKMSEIVAREPLQRFFVATDDPSELEHLRQHFPDRIVHRPARSYDRSNPEAIEDALVELLCLAGTQMIIGSSQSTFSAVAGKLGNIEVTYAQVESDPEIIW